VILCGKPLVEHTDYSMFVTVYCDIRICVAIMKKPKDGGVSSTQIQFKIGVLHSENYISQCW